MKPEQIQNSCDAVTSQNAVTSQTASPCEVEAGGSVQHQLRALWSFETVWILQKETFSVGLWLRVNMYALWRQASVLSACEPLSFGKTSDWGSVFKHVCGFSQVPLSLSFFSVFLNEWAQKNQTSAPHFLIYRFLSVSLISVSPSRASPHCYGFMWCADVSLFFFLSHRSNILPVSRSVCTTTA